MIEWSVTGISLNLGRVLPARNDSSQQESLDRQEGLNRQLTQLRRQLDHLPNLRLLGEIDDQSFAHKNTELRDRVARPTPQLEACDRRRAEKADLAVKVLERSQALEQKWLGAVSPAKRQLLEIVCLNFRLNGVTLVPEMRQPDRFRLPRCLWQLSSALERLNRRGPNT